MAKGKYHEWLQPEGLLRITNWAANGLTYAEIAQNMGVTEKTLYTWVERFGEILQAIKSGRAMSCEAVENALFKRATGMTLTDTVTTEEFEGALVDGKPADGRVKRQERTTVREVPPDTGAIIFYLKNRMPDRYADRRETKVDVAVPTISLGIDPARADS